ncbi:transcriptional regulator [Fulvitalea axinellae]|uniref:Transcriptional regulator n=1 Tax=Fulvitalea axinellae TaxID=1182444 RepID=A0AAU9CMW0_9BACT|nr:transcriptional regulator [Fulvitalea axinellae]
MKDIPIRTVQPSDFTGNFTIRNLSDVLMDKDMNEGLHRHDFYFLLILRKGEGEHHIDFQHYPVGDRMVFLIRPWQVHQLRLKRGNKGYLLFFDASFYPSKEPQRMAMLRKVALTNAYTLPQSEFARLLSVAESIFEEYKGRGFAYKEAVKAYLEIIFIELGRQCRTGVDERNPDSLKRLQLEEFLDLLETRICEQKQVSYYAERLSLTPYQLNAMTKRALGATCSQLITKQIVLEAKRNLLATSSQVNEIAHGLGYEDPAYFIRFFKKQTGFTPEAFRKNFS